MEKNKDFLFNNFIWNLDYLKGQFSRLWQRFNFFLTVEMALFSFFGWLAFGNSSAASVRFACMLGIFISVLWYIVAAQDRALVEIYRDRLSKAAAEIATVAGFESYARDFVGNEAESQFRPWKIVWYCRYLSITVLPIWISLLTLLAWIGLIFLGAEWLRK